MHLPATRLVEPEQLGQPAVTGGGIDGGAVHRVLLLTGGEPVGGGCHHPLACASEPRLFGAVGGHTAQHERDALAARRDCMIGQADPSADERTDDQVVAASESGGTASTGRRTCLCRCSGPSIRCRRDRRRRQRASARNVRTKSSSCSSTRRGCSKAGRSMPARPTPTAGSASATAGTRVRVCRQRRASSTASPDVPGAGGVRRRDHGVGDQRVALHDAAELRDTGVDGHHAASTCTVVRLDAHPRCGDDGDARRLEGHRVAAWRPRPSRTRACRRARTRCPPGVSSRRDTAPACRPA